MLTHVDSLILLPGALGRLGAGQSGCLPASGSAVSGVLRTGDRGDGVVDPLLDGEPRCWKERVALSRTVVEGESDTPGEPPAAYRRRLVAGVGSRGCFLVALSLPLIAYLPCLMQLLTYQRKLEAARISASVSGAAVDPSPYPSDRHWDAQQPLAVRP